MKVKRLLEELEEKIEILTLNEDESSFDEAIELEDIIIETQELREELENAIEFDSIRADIMNMRNSDSIKVKKIGGEIYIFVYMQKLLICL